MPTMNKYDPNNLYYETLMQLDGHGKSADDVEWVGIKGKSWSTWDNFVNCADNWYNQGDYGLNIKADLLVVGKDFWLERDGYAGKEWWKYIEIPQKPEQQTVYESKDIGNFDEIKTKSMKRTINDITNWYIEHGTIA